MIDKVVKKSYTLYKYIKTMIKTGEFVSVQRERWVLKSFYT